MITRLLVANRGEIARRVFRTCRELGISTVAVFSDADAESPHVAEADLAVRLPGVRPSETYLDVERLLAACRASGADAVHPGYGFLSESADFAREVLAAGLVWVGPPPEAIAAMGVKIGAKRLMTEAGVPVLPSLDLAAPEEFPLLVKASAGAAGAGCGWCAGPRSWRGRWSRRGGRPPRRSATAPCSPSRCWSGPGTWRCRCWPTGTAPCGRWASASAACSGGTRRWSRSVPRRASRRRRAPCCTRPRRGPRARSGTSAPAPWSSWSRATGWRSLR
ncbi:Methylcrotonyl-CoA carboxylase biotin-containing subunit [[Actinomadura] parvosata subsp. kistnae]|nr:Methylcrotonyl-CoA carboxylase biotin-containing subunit [Actinomadura parvosata subsp. kistnae]